MKLNVVCMISGSSGYSVHGRKLIQALINEGCDVGIETALQPNWQIDCPQDLLKIIESGKDNRDETTIFISTPPTWNQKLSDRPKNFIGFLVFEGDRLPSGWVEQCNEPRVDLIFVPSEHTASAVKTSGVTKMIKIIPHGVDLSTFNLNVKPHIKLQSDKFTFVFVGGWAIGDADRKNLSFLIRAFGKEFKKDEDVRLLIKLNPAYIPQGWDMNAAFNALKIPENHAEITVTPDYMHEDELARVYKCGQVFVCPTKAEAFGMVFAEAMALGLPCIAGGYGGQTDFINNDNGWLLKPKLIKASEPNPLYEETKWAEYDENELRKLLRYCYEHPDEVEKKGFQAFSDIQSYSWNNTAKKVIEAINDLEYYKTLKGDEHFA